jgi:hypothetical protein
MPFREDGIGKEDVFAILDGSGIGVPRYYSWRSRSGCYFCFFQQQEEWAGLKRNHPDLFEAAKTYERVDEKTGRLFTWNQAGPLDEVLRRSEENRDRPKKSLAQKKLIDAWSQDGDESDDACLICMK